MALSFKIKKHKITLIGSECLKNKMKRMFEMYAYNSSNSEPESLIYSIYMQETSKYFQLSFNISTVVF